LRKNCRLFSLTWCRLVTFSYCKMLTEWGISLHIHTPYLQRPPPSTQFHICEVDIRHNVHECDLKHEQKTCANARTLNFTVHAVIKSHQQSHYTALFLCLQVYVLLEKGSLGRGAGYHGLTFNHPVSRLPSRQPVWSIDTTSSTEDLWRSAWETDLPANSMTQLFPCLVPTCPDGSGAFWTVSAQALADVQPVSISGVIPTTHCASVEPPRPCRTSLTAARYTSSKVVSLPSTQHLIPRWSGCAIAAYAKEKERLKTLSLSQR